MSGKSSLETSPFRARTAQTEQHPLQLVAFRLGDHRFAISLAATERILPMVAVSPLPQAPLVALGVINLHGQVIPVLDVRSRFRLPAKEPGLAGQLMVARTPRRTVAIPVDEVLGPTEVALEAVADPEAILPGIGYLAGVVALADGILFIHELDTFLSLDEDRELSEALGNARSVKRSGIGRQPRDENESIPLEDGR